MAEKTFRVKKGLDVEGPNRDSSIIDGVLTLGTIGNISGASSSILSINSLGSVNINLDTNTNDTNSVFKIREDNTDFFVMDNDGNITIVGDLSLGENKKIYFDSTDTYIYADTDSSEDLHIGADGHIELEPDNDLIVKVGTTEYVRFDGSAQSVGIGTNGPDSLLHVKGTDAILTVEDTSIGVDALSRTMAGIDLISDGMNNSASKYGTALKFLSTDGQFTTENPKFLAAIVPRATETYSADTDGGMALDLAVTDDNPGTTNVPAVKMTIDHTGYVGIGTTSPSYDLHVVGSGYFTDDLRVGDVTPGKITLNGNDAYVQGQFEAAGTAGSYIYSLALGTASPTASSAGKFETSGDVQAGSMTIGGHTFDDIDIGTEFVDTDDHIMSSGAIKEKIESYNYLASVDISANTNLAVSSPITLTGDTVGLDDPVNLTELTESTDATDDKILLWDETASSWKYMTLDNLQDSIDTTASGGASALDGLTDVLISDNSLFINNFGSAPTTGTLSTASDNLAIGDAALNSITSGDQNLALGYQALTGITTGSNNIGLGPSAGAQVTAGITESVFIGNGAGFRMDGDYNIALGTDSMKGSSTNTNNTGANNVGIGYLALFDITSADRNVAIGYAPLQNVTTGGYNVAIGNNTLGSVTTGVGNVAIGSGTADLLTDGDSNVAIGAAMGDVDTGIDKNVAIGYTAGRYLGSNDNVAIGNAALVGSSTATNNTGARNVAIGKEAMDAFTSGADNIAIGFGAAGAVTSGGNHVAIGREALGTVTSNSSNTAVGYQAGKNLSGTGNVAFGPQALLGLTSGTINGGYNIAMGYQPMWEIQTGDKNLAIGFEAMQMIRTGTSNIAVGNETMKEVDDGADYNITLGYQAGYYIGNNDNVAIGYRAMKGSTSSGSNTGSKNIAIGYTAMESYTTATDNVAIGRNALADVTTGSNNIAIGEHALSATDGASAHNIMMGYFAGTNLKGGVNVGIGSNALAGSATVADNIGTYNVGIGHFNLSVITSGDDNIGIGQLALRNVSSGNQNIGIGHDAGTDITTGSGNILIGKDSGHNIVDGSYNVLIGEDAGQNITSGDDNLILHAGDNSADAPSSATADRQLRISSGSHVWFYGYDGNLYLGRNYLRRFPASGTDAPGSDLEIGGSAGTGAGVGGDIKLQYSPAGSTGDTNNAHVDAITISGATGDVTIHKNLIVSGSTTTLNTATMTVEDHNIVLGSGNATAEVVDGTGLTLEGGSGDDITFQYNTTDNRMELKHGSSFEDFKAGTVTGTFVGGLTGDVTGNVTGNVSGSAATVTGAAQSAITSLGTLTALTGGTGDLVWDTNTLVVDSSASRVGIGTTTPTAKLEVDGTIKVDPTGTYSAVVGSGSDTSTTAGLVFDGYADLFLETNGYLRRIIGANSNVITIGQDSTSIWNTIDLIPGHSGKIRLYSDNSDAATNSAELTMTIDDAKVGIGTTSPDAKLEIEQTDGAVHGLKVYRNDSSTSTPLVYLHDDSIYVDSPTLHVKNDRVDQYGYAAVFEGKVGIGTTVPDQKLHVEGSILADAYNFATTTLASNYTDGATSLVLTDASQFPLKGSGTINGVAFTWTSISGNTLTVPDLDASYTAGVTVVADTGLFFRDGFENVAQPSVTVYDRANSGASRDDLSINANSGIRFRLGNESQMQLTTDQLSLTTGNQGAAAIFGFRDRTDMGIKSNSSYSVGVLAPDNVYINIDSNNNNADNTAFIVAKNSNAVGSGTELFRVAEDGKVGIGVAPSSAKLEIGDGTDLASINPTYVQLYNSDGSSSNATVKLWAETWGGKVGTTSSDDFFIVAHNSDRMKFDGSMRTTFYGSSSADPIIRLSTKDTTVSAGDDLGVIEWAAGSEGDGSDGDARLVAASISAVAEADFNDTANTTSLVFKTGTSEEATEKMRLLSTGQIELSGTTVGAPADTNHVRLGFESEVLRIDSNEGYVQVGCQNTTYCHFVTNRGKFYFNRELIVNEGIVSSHDEDLKLQRVNTTADQIQISEDSQTFTVASTAVMGLTSSQVTIDGSLTLKERASAPADNAGYGQLWVKSDGDGELYFTDDNGTDIQLTDDGAATGSGGGGAVSAVANGANNRIATFSSADALNGEANLTFDGSTLALAGKQTITVDDTVSEAFKVTITDTDSTADSTPFVVDGNGRVGIGTASPLTDMALTLNGDGTTYEGLAFQSGGSTKWKLSTDGAAFYHDSQVNTLDYNIRLRDSSGNYNTMNLNADTAGTIKMGLGVTPVALLHVKADSSATSQTTAGSANITIEQDGTGDAALNFLLSGVRRWTMGIDNSDSDKFKIQTGATSLDGTSHVPALTIASNGDTGINQTSPAALLHIKGSENSWDKHIRLENHDTTDYGAIVVDNQGMKFRIFTNGHDFHFRDNDNNTLLQIQDGAGIKFNNAYEFPTSDGSANQVLTTNGSGTLTFEDAGGVKEFVIFGEESDFYVSSSATAGNANGFFMAYGNGVHNTTRSSSGSDFGFPIPKDCTLVGIHMTFGNNGSETNSSNQTITVFKNEAASTTTFQYNASGTGGNVFQKSFTSFSGTGTSFSAGDTFNLRATGLSGFTNTQVGPVRVAVTFRET